MGELQLADTPLYITLAILTAIAAIISSDVREGKSVASKMVRNVPAFVVVVGSMVCILQIAVCILMDNKWEALSKAAAIHMIVHMVTLLMIFVFAPLWYRSVVIHRETPAGMPNPPSAKQ